MKPSLFLPTTALCALALTAGGTPARATINSSAVDCQPVSAPQQALVHNWEGVETTVSAVTDTYVSCSVYRSPLTTVGAPGVFRLAGQIFSGATMPCTLTSYEYTGTFLGSATVLITSPPDGRWKRVVQEVSLPASQLPYWAYTSLVCLLPQSGAAWISSISSVQ